MWHDFNLSFKFHYPYLMVWFLSPDGYIDGYMLDYGSFTLVNELVFKSKIPFLHREVYNLGCQMV